MKTIRMPRELANAWLTALRNGEYQQGVGALKVRLENGTSGYCCLGVLQHCVDGTVEKSYGGPPKTYPSMQWIEARGIEFLNRFMEPSNRPYLHRLNADADVANDRGDDFKQIADALEAEIEFTEGDAP